MILAYETVGSCDRREAILITEVMCAELRQKEYVFLPSSNPEQAILIT